MEKKEILNLASGDLEILAKEQKYIPLGSVFELLVKNDPSIPRNEDPDLARLEQIIISLMRQEFLYTPDIIQMSYQDKNIITIKRIGEVKLDFVDIEGAIVQRENFLPDLKKFLENFDKEIRERGLVFEKFGKPLRIVIQKNCPIFYVLPEDVDLPEGISQVEVRHSPFAREEIRQKTQELARF